MIWFILRYSRLSTAGGPLRLDDRCKVWTEVAKSSNWLTERFLRLSCIDFRWVVVPASPAEEVPGSSSSSSGPSSSSSFGASEASSGAADSLLDKRLPLLLLSSGWSFRCYIDVSTLILACPLVVSSLLNTLAVGTFLLRSKLDRAYTLVVSESALCRLACFTSLSRVMCAWSVWVEWVSDILC